MTNCMLRTNQLFSKETGRSFMVAFDRPITCGPQGGAQDPEQIISQIVAADPDAVLLSPGAIRRFGHHFAYRGAPQLVCRLDLPSNGTSSQGDGEVFGLICEVDEAAAIGANAVVMFLASFYRGKRTFVDNAVAVGQVAAKCRRHGIPLIVEAVPWGEATPSMNDVEAVAEVSRIAAELGADIVKTEWVGSIDTMKSVIDSCPVPIVVLGGPKVPLPEMEAFTRDALKAGARGLAYGRNIWQREDITGTASALRRIVHS